MDLHLTEARALVTGSTAGIGYAIAERLAAEGATVFVNGRTQARVDAAIASIAKAHPGARLHGVVADVATPEGTRAAIEATGELDVLVNNMGIFEPRPWAEITDAEWRAMFETNVVSGARLSQHHLPRMLGRNRGRVLFISSESGVQVPPEMIHYGVSKTAQAALARGLAQQVKSSAVTVNTVLVGPTRSEGVDEFLRKIAAQNGTSVEQVERDFFRNERPNSLIQRFLKCEEIADLVAFLASPRSSAVHGAALRAEGGLLQGVL